MPARATPPPYPSPLPALSQVASVTAAGREAEIARLQQAAAGASSLRLPWPAVQAVIDGGDRLGGGAFGSVFRGRLDVGAGLREVAVKLVVVGGGGPQATSEARFKGEVGTLSSLRHPHLLRCVHLFFLSIRDV